MSWPLRKSSSSSLTSSTTSTTNTAANTTTINNTSHLQNTINRQSSASCNLGLVVPRSVQLDFDKEEKKIQELELTNKKFYKDVKSYVVKIDELNKSETKLISNLSNLANQPSITNSILTSVETTANISTISTTEEDKEFLSQLKQWRDLLNDHNSSCDHLKQSCQQQVIEPMKKLNSLFPQVYEAIKRRQQAYNEFTRQQAKLDKALEKERTGPQLVRNEQLNQLVQNAKQQFDREHALLMEELPKLYNSRVDYIRPCVQALLESQANFYENYTSFYDSILECHKNDSIIASNSNLNKDDDLESNSNKNNNKTDNEIDDEIQKCLNEIKSLSIVAGD